MRTDRWGATQACSATWVSLVGRIPISPSTSSYPSSHLSLVLSPLLLFSAPPLPSPTLKLGSFHGQCHFMCAPSIFANDKTYIVKYKSRGARATINYYPSQKYIQSEFVALVIRKCWNQLFYREYFFCLLFLWKINIYVEACMTLHLCHFKVMWRNQMKMEDKERQESIGGWFFVWFPVIQDFKNMQNL